MELFVHRGRAAKIADFYKQYRHHVISSLSMIQKISLNFFSSFFHAHYLLEVHGDSSYAKIVVGPNQVQVQVRCTLDANHYNSY